MRSGRGWAWGALVCAWVGLLPRLALAIPACSQDDMIAQEVACGTTGNCTISKSYEIPLDSPCVFDFSGRNVTLAGTARVTVGSGDATFLSANFTMAPGAFIDGQGTGTGGQQASGGKVRIQASGNVDLQGVSGTRSRIDVSANVGGGLIDIRAGGNASLNGRLIANNFGGRLTADGGTIVVMAGGNLSSNSTPQTEITAAGGSQAPRGGGAIDLEAGGDINLATNTILDIRGSNGGTLDLLAGRSVSLGGITGSGTGAAGGGGTVTISAGHGVTLLGAVSLNGGSADPTAGGEGGAFTVETLLGDVQLAANVLVQGSGPDGDGGEIDISANGSIRLSQGVTLSAKSLGSEGVGGSVSLAPALDLVSQSQSATLIDVGGGGGGGGLDIEAGRHVTLAGKVDVSGNAAGGIGGDVSIVAGAEGTGSLTVTANVDVQGGGCSLDAGCGDGGTTDLSACDITIGSSATITANAPGTAGTHQLSARKLLGVNGIVTARKTQSSGADGSVTIEHPPAFPPSLGTNRVRPAPQLNPKPFCSEEIKSDCLMPCPVCGNNIVEFPETCDGGNTLSCDGCSALCQVELCPPAAFCPGGVSCDPQIGCAFCPDAPTPTPSDTPTPRPTPTPSASPTFTPSSSPTHSPTTTPTGTPSATESSTPTFTTTASRTPSPSLSPTPTLTASPTATASHSPSPSPTVSPSVTGSPTPSRTPTFTSSATPSASPTQTPSTTATFTASPTLTSTPSASPSAPPTQTWTPSATATFTASPTPTPSSTATPLPSHTPAQAVCPGDCNLDDEVTVDEILRLVNVALGLQHVDVCPAGDSNGDSEVTIDEILQAVNSALNGCPL